MAPSGSCVLVENCYDILDDDDDDDDDDDEIRSLCGALAVVRLLVQTKISLDY